VTYPLRSASKVWLPSWRFTPFDSLPVLFRTGSALGIRPSECSPLPRYSTVSGRVNPHAIPPAVATTTEAVGRPRGPRLLGFDPCESPWPVDTGLVRRPLDTPMGFALPGYSSESLGRDFAQPPLSRFTERPESSHRRLRVCQHPLGLIRAPTANHRNRRRQPS